MDRGDIDLFSYRVHAHRYLKSFIYGGLDGIITTFAVVAGVAGASLSAGIVLILGFANLFADGISMAVGDYLSTKSEREYHIKRRSGVNVPLRNAAVTFCSFLFFGFIPLLAYVMDYFFELFMSPFYTSVMLTFFALFLLGMAKYRITYKHPVRSGLEMVLLGGFAAGAAYLVGYLLAGFV